MQCGFCGARAVTARYTEHLSPGADGVHRSCVCGADGVEAADAMDEQEAFIELVLDRLQLAVRSVAPFAKLRMELEALGYDAVVNGRALWVRPASTQMTKRLVTSTMEAPAPVTFDGDDRDRVLMLRLPPRPGMRALLVDFEPVKVGGVRAYLRDTSGSQPSSWLHLPDDAWATHLTLAEARAYAGWCGKRVPTDADWERIAADDIGGILRGVGEIWEWTETPHPRGGWVVRGGPWRDRAGRGLATNRSREDTPAGDVGVRLVRDE